MQLSFAKILATLPAPLPLGTEREVLMPTAANPAP